MAGKAPDVRFALFDTDPRASKIKDVGLPQVTCMRLPSQRIRDPGRFRPPGLSPPKQAGITMFGIGVPELLIVGFIVLVLFGSRLPT